MRCLGWLVIAVMLIVLVSGVAMEGLTAERHPVIQTLKEDGYYSNPDNYKERPTPKFEFREGVFEDQLGNPVLVNKSTAKNYRRGLSGEEFFEIKGVQYYRNPAGGLFVIK